jgi:hypothetical protein
MSEAIGVLVLHQLGNPVLRPPFMQLHLRSFEQSWPESACLFHDVSLPLPEWVRSVPFDAVILDVTFLSARYGIPDNFAAVLRDYAFVRDLPAMRIALPQDEYYCSSVLDEWMCDWRVDLVLSVAPDHHAMLYPRYHRQGRIARGFTGYVEENLLRRTWPQWSDRPIDIGYRAKRLPPYCGRIGELKWRIAGEFLAQAGDHGLAVDIAVGDAHNLVGEAWLDFVGSCKSMLGTPSGSSIIDPRGEVQRKVRAYLAHNPTATFEQVEAACFPGMEGQYVFSMLSPRNIEAALGNTLQLLTPGDYSGILRAGEHYVLLEPDASNVKDIRDALRDTRAMAAMIERCRDAIMSNPQLRRTVRDEWLREEICEHRSRQKRSPSVLAVARAIERYEAEMVKARRWLWRKQSFIASLRRRLDRAPPMVVSTVRSALFKLRGMR